MEDGGGRDLDEEDVEGVDPEASEGVDEVEEQRGVAVVGEGGEVPEHEELLGYEEDEEGVDGPEEADVGGHREVVALVSEDVVDDDGGGAVGERGDGSAQIAPAVAKAEVAV